MLKVYGIPNCDTVRKVLRFLDGRKVKYEFVNFKTDPVSRELLRDWMDQAGWEAILNKKSSTYRDLPAEEKAGLTTAARARKIIMQNNSIIRRPVITKDGVIIAIGYQEDTYQQLFKK